MTTVSAYARSLGFQVAWGFTFGWGDFLVHRPRDGVYDEGKR
jgi:hypothetical protein